VSKFYAFVCKANKASTKRFSLSLVELSQSQAEFVEALRDRVNERWQSVGLDDLVINDDFHMSISRTFNVKKKVADQLSEFIDSEFKFCSKY